MTVPKLPIKVIIVCVFFAIIGALWGSHAAGLIDLTPFLTDLPVVGKYFPEESEETITNISPLEEENEELKDKLTEMENKLAETTAKETTLQQTIEEYKAQIAEIEEEKQSLIDQENKAVLLADYYQNMKPKEVVPIFDNLDDEIVISILAKMEVSQVAKIIAELDPIRAAKLTKTITDIYNSSD
ncbi:MAG: MotE family protein [Peptococcaceae bacterium]